MFEEYKVTGRSGNLRLRVDPVDPANPSPVNEIKLVNKAGPSRTGTEASDAKKATINLSEGDFKKADREIVKGDLVSYKTDKTTKTSASIKDFWF
jgi:hypothetical protein